MTRADELVRAASWLFDRHDTRKDEASRSQYVSSVLRASYAAQQMVLTRWNDERNDWDALRSANEYIKGSTETVTVEDVTRFLSDRIPDFSQRFRVSVEDNSVLVTETGKQVPNWISVRRVRP